MNQRKRELTCLSVSVLCSLLVIGVLWIFPALQATAETEQTFGTTQSISMTATSPRSRQFVWEFQLNVSGDPDTVDIWPRLPFTTNVSSGSKPGDSNLVTTFRVYAQDQQIGYRVHGSHTGGYSTATTVGEPQYFDEIKQGFLVRGENRIRVVADVVLQVTKSGTETFDHTLGPARIAIYSADRDDDGVQDEHQVVPFFTGLGAIPATVLVGGVSFWLLNRRLRTK